MAGVTSQGFVVKTFGEIQDALRTAFRGTFGAQVNVETRSRLGQLIELFSDPLSEAWELAEVLSAAFDPASAAGVLLENLTALTGTTRRAAFPSTVDLILVGTTGTNLPVGRVVRVDGTVAAFESLALATLAATSAWGAATYAVGDRRSSDGAVWLVTAIGSGASTVAPTGAGPTFAEGSAIIWRRLGTGTGSIVGAFASTVDGPIQGYAGTITVIDTPVAGWTGAFNLLDAAPGALEETDLELRTRRQREIAAIGTSPLPSITARLLRVAGVTSAVVFENTTDVTVDGIAPHAIEAMVEGGADQAIWDALFFEGRAGGIETSGGEVGGTMDSEGNSHVVRFSRPTQVDTYQTLHVTKDPAVFPVDGEAQIKAAVVAYGDARGVGLDVVASGVGAQAFKVPGVLEVPTVYIGTSPSPVSSAKIPISVRERAAYDTSRIVVVLSNGSP